MKISRLILSIFTVYFEFFYLNSSFPLHKEISQHLEESFNRLDFCFFLHVTTYFPSNRIYYHLLQEFDNWVLSMQSENLSGDIEDWCELLFVCVCTCVCIREK